MKTFKHNKPTRQKLRKIRALLRDAKEANAHNVAEEIGASYGRANTLLNELIKMGQVRIAYTVTKRGGQQFIYSLTDSYLAKLKTDGEGEGCAVDGDPVAQRNFAITYIREVRKPWYKRALSWLTGGSDLRAGA